MTEYTMWTGEDIIPLWIPVLLLFIGCIYFLLVVIIMKSLQFNFTNSFFVFQSVMLAIGLIIFSIVLGNKTYKEGTTKHFCHNELKIDQPIYRTYNSTKYLYSYDQKVCSRLNEYIAIDGKWRHVVKGLTIYEQELKKKRKENNN